MHFDLIDVEGVVVAEIDAGVQWPGLLYGQVASLEWLWAGVFHDTRWDIVARRAYLL